MKINSVTFSAEERTTLNIAFPKHFSLFSKFGLKSYFMSTEKTGS